MKNYDLKEKYTSKKSCKTVTPHGLPLMLIENTANV
jgi:hypothetical protein